MTIATEAGTPYPLGATLHSEGVNFAIFSSNATQVDLILFDRAGNETAIPLTQRLHDVWHVFVRGVHAGQLYAYRLHGPFAPERGQRFNPSKLLLDPYARALTHRVEPGEEALAYSSDSPGEPSSHDSACCVPRCVVTDPSFDWQGDTPLRHSWSRTIIYETHVKGFTKLHPDIPPNLRGTYAGLASDAAITYLLDLGITAVELLPVHAHVNDQRLRDLGLSNYWGYNTIGFFAPEPSYAAAVNPIDQVREFKEMVKRLHRAGIEVILDVVYNHTGEGNHLGPTLSFRGIDNVAYYRLSDPNPAYYADVTGTGNTINILQPRTIQLIADSLRYWVLEMHVDGFRFDLASALGRDEIGFSPGASFFDVLLQDPVLSQVKLIAEPWDLGDYGYQVGGFPHPWSEWNGKFRDVVRSFWRGDQALVDELASRLAGSSDIYSHSRRPPSASINFVTSHDGFTLLDLVSYNEKHNWANGEENRDGDNTNHSWNHGVEGTTDDPEINRLRRRQARNLISCLLLAQGVPMVHEGDEYLRTKNGNNNTYCQDNELNWISWDRGPEAEQFRLFTQKMIAFRKAHPALRRSSFFRGRLRDSEGPKRVSDLVWFTEAGREMEVADWHAADRRSLAMQINGSIRSTDVEEPDDTILIVIHSGAEPQTFLLPGSSNTTWRTVIDTADEDGFVDRSPLAAGDRLLLEGRSLQVLLLASGSPEEAQEELTTPVALLELGPESASRP
ncbi:MAG: glycogen debranching protein GlgX [Verrucomicrobiia bacterium]